MHKRALLVLVGAFAAPVAAEPLVRTGTSYYYIDGTSALVLTEQMRQKGPQGADGKHHPSRTKWSVQWRFRHNMHDGVCKMEQVAVAVGIMTTRPRWRGEADSTVALKARWRQLSEAVDRNQAFHERQAKQAGNEIEAALLSMPPEESCDALTEAANARASAIQKKHQAASEREDRRTDYGRTDGASLI